MNWFGVLQIAVAEAEYRLADYRCRTRDRDRHARLEAEDWEDTHLLPLMSDAQRDAFITERRHRNERREDIERQEQQHRELVEAQRQVSRAVNQFRREARELINRKWYGEIL